MSIERPLFALLLSTAQAPSVADPEEEPGPLSSPGFQEGDEADEAPRHSFLSTSVTLGPALDSGFLVAGEEVDDTMYIARPTVYLEQHPSERTALTIAWEPELQAYQDHGDLDGVEHVAGLLLQHAATRRSSFVLGGAFLDGEDPGRHMAGDLLVMPRAPYRQWRAYAGFSHRWSRSFLLLDVGRTSTRVETLEGPLASDQTDDALTLTLGRDLGSRVHLSASYSYLDPTFEPTEATDETLEETLPRFVEPVQTVTLGLGVQSTPRIGFFVDGGVLHENDESLFIGGLEVTKTADRHSIRLRYDHSPLSLGPSLTSPGAGPAQPGGTSAGLRDAVTDTLAASLRTRPFRRVRWDQSVWGSRTDLPGGSTVDSVALTSRLVVEVTERFGTLVQVQLLEQDGPEILGGSLSRTHAFAGVIIGLSGPPGTWGIREEPDALRQVLPNRRDF
jgi:hypothetical protein